MACAVRQRQSAAPRNRLRQGPLRHRHGRAAPGRKLHRGRARGGRAHHIRSFSISVTGAESLAPIAINLCMLFSLLNPLAAYMGYYGNITGDSGLMNLYCGRIGIDSSTQTFSFLFYKAASIVCILMGIAFIALAVWQMEKQAKE